MNNILICFSWRKSDIFYFDLDLNLINKKKFILDESWGLTNDGKSLIVSDGSDVILYINPNTFEIERKIKTEYKKINALCYANNLIYGNIWCENIIICIDPKQNKVVNKWDFNYLFSEKNSYKLDINSPHCKILDKTTKENVLNGIAYIPELDQFYITGKNWKQIYVIKLK